MSNFIIAFVIKEGIIDCGVWKLPCETTILNLRVRERLKNLFITVMNSVAYAL